MKIIRRIGGIVYDIDNLKIYFKSYDNQNIKSIPLSDFDFGENSKSEYGLINSKDVNFKEYNTKSNKKLITSAMEMMNLKIDINLANAHQMKPTSINVDSIFQNNYADLTINFITDKSNGILKYSLIKGEENFKTYSGFNMGTIPISEKRTKIILYNQPKGEFALACFQDTNGDNKMDTNFLGIPVHTGFSNNKKKLFGIPPSYDTAKIILDEPKTIDIKIR